MSAIVGHLGARVSLEKYLPPASLLNGPVSVGKHALAMHLASFHRTGFGDVLDIERLTVSEAHRLTEHFSRRPAGRIRLGIVNLDGSTDASQNSILKLVEEPPPDCHLVLLTSQAGRVLLTLHSRCFRLYLGPLRTEEVAQVLVQRLEWAPQKAAQAARTSGGTIQGALRSAEDQQIRNRALPILTAMVSADAVLASNSTEILWDAIEGPVVLRALRTWAVEARSGQYRYFAPGDGVELVRRGCLEAVAKALTSGARPVIAVRAAIVAASRVRVS